jgi:hypothetical protein
MASNVTYELTLSDKQIIASLDRVIDKLKDVNSEADKTQSNIRQTGRVIASSFDIAQKETNDLTNDYKDLGNEATKTGRKIENAFDIDTSGASKEAGNLVTSFNELIEKGGEFKEALASGDISAIGQSFSSISGGITGLLNPITLATAGVAALGGALVVTALNAKQGAQELEDLKKQIDLVSNSTEDELTDVAINLKASADTFGLNATDLLDSAKTLAENRGITLQEASTLLSEGLENGLDPKLLGTIQEYDEAFRSLGFTSQETIEFARQASNAGFNLNKLFASVRNAGIKLADFGPEVVKSLDVLGPEFSKRIQNELQTTGTLGIKTLQDIGKQSEKLNLSAQQRGDLLSGIFGDKGVKQGEKLLKFLADFNSSLGDNERATNANVQENIALNQANRALQEQYAILGPAVDDAGDRLELFLVNVKTFATQSLIGLINFVNQVGEILAPIFDPIIKGFKEFGAFLSDAGEQVTIFFDNFIASSGVIEGVIKPAFELIKNLLGGIFDGIKTQFKFLAQIPAGIVKVFGFVNSIIDTIRTKIVEFVPFLKPVIDAIFSGFDAIRKVVNSVVDSFSNAASAGNLLGKVYNVLQAPLKAIIETLQLAVVGTRVFGNEIKKLSNQFLGTNFDINPELSTNTFNKQLADYKKKAGNFFITPTVKPTLDKKQAQKVAKDAQKSINEEREKIQATPIAKEGGDKEEFQIKITADIKPFLDAVQKAKDEIRLIGENEQVRIIQFQTAVDEITLRRSQEGIERAKLESEQRIATIQLAFATENALREADIRRKTALENLDTQRAEQLKSISELKSVVLQNQKRAELEKAYQAEKAKIQANADTDRLNIEQLNNQKRLELEREQQRAVALLQLRTIEEQRKRIEESLKAQQQKQFDNLRTILSDTRLFEEKRELEISITIANRGEIEKQLTADLQRIDTTIADFRNKIATATPRNQGEREQLEKDIQILRNLEIERANVITASNNKILDEERRLIEAQKKIAQEELNLRKERFERQVAQAENFVNRTNQAFDTITDLNEKFRNRIAPGNLRETFDTSLLVINSFVTATRRSLGSFINQFGEIGKIKFSLRGVQESARAIDDEIAVLNEQIQKYKAQIRELARTDADPALKKLAQDQLDAFLKQRDVLEQQRKTLVGDRNVLQERIKLLDENIAKTQEALRTGRDTDTGENLEENQRKRAQESLEALKKQREDANNLLKASNSDIDKLLKERIKRVVDVSTNIAEVVSNAVFDALKAGSDALIQVLDAQIQSSEDRINKITDALKAGGKEAQNFSVEQLEIEQARQDELERQRASELEKLQAYTIAQIALNGAIAIARTFAEYPFPVSLGIAALQGAAIFASILAIRSQAQAVKAEKGIVDINDASLTDSRGVIKGKRHSQGGVLIEAEGGETILSRKHTLKFKNLLEQIHGDKLSDAQIKGIEYVLKNKGSVFPKLDLALPQLRPEVSHKAIILQFGQNHPGRSHEYKQLITEMQGMRKDLKESAPQVTAILNERGVWAIQDRKNKRDRMRNQTRYGKK